MKQTVQRAKNIANHVAFVLDASGSMNHLSRKVIEVADRQVKHLAQRSTEYNQETRVSIWVFSSRHTVQCVIWDMDVLRLPSIAEFYSTSGNTALIDATVKSIDDLSTVSQIYGDHSFLMFVLTDGGENDSLLRDPQALANKIKGLNDNWTVAALVPDIQGVVMAKQFGFPAGNIQMWDATSERGLEAAHQTIMASTDAYMTARSTGLRSTTSLFDMSAAAVNKQTIQAAGLTPLDTSEYILTTVVYTASFQKGDDWISTYTTNVLGHQYVAGRGFYQLTLEPVKVQVQKDIAIVEKKSGRVFTGKNARALLGLPDTEVTLRAGQNSDYDIFIQSTSPNRKLLHGQRYLYLTPQVSYSRPAPVVPAQAVPKVAKMPLLPQTVARRAATATAVARAVAVATGTKKAPIDLTAPIWPKGAKVTWAGRACPACRVSAGKRCLNGDGAPMEKPHTARKI